MKALFISRNLIGDGLYISPALQQWYAEHPDAEITLLTNNDHITPLYRGMGVPMRVITEFPEYEVGSFDFEHTFDCNKAFQISHQYQCHIAESYAKLLGITLEAKPNYAHLKPTYIPLLEPIEDEYKNLVLISMFSMSCSSREGKLPNKMLPWPKWKPILRFLRTRFKSDGTTIKFLGAPTDRVPPEEGLEISEEEYMTGIPLNRLALIMRYARLLVTVDNGMSHLAATQETPTFLMYPACLGTHYIVPRGNPNMRFVQIDPVHVTPASITYSMGVVMKELLKVWMPL